MVYKIEEPNKQPKYIATVNEANTTLTFTTSESSAYQRYDGIIGNSTFDYLKFHFMEKYPELQYMTKINSY